MPRPDDPMYPVYVQFERFRAAEFSKELSVKVSHGCVRIAQQGYWVGGNPPYGYDRLLLDESRKPVHVLKHRQKKSIQNQRVTLTVGPEEQVTTVRRIFNEFIEERLNTEQISDGLNHDGLRSARGELWNASKIRQILTNVMYAGTLVYNKTTKKLKTRTRKNPRDQWIKTVDAFVGLVEPSVFDRAQAIIAEALQRYSPAKMLEHLERLHREHGFIRSSFLRVDE
jgi:Recombinase